MVNLARLPKGFGIVYRHYDHLDRSALGRRLMRRCATRKIPMLWGWRPGLPPPPSSAWGVHLPAVVAPPPWLNKKRLSAAVHCRRQLAHAIAVRAKAVLLSPVFATAAHKDARPLGRYRLAALIRKQIAAYALGGITAKTAKRLAGLPLGGLAMHGFLLGGSPGEGD